MDYGDVRRSLELTDEIFSTLVTNPGSYTLEELDELHTKNPEPYGFIKDAHHLLLNLFLHGSSPKYRLVRRMYRAHLTPLEISGTVMPALGQLGLITIGDEVGLTLQARERLRRELRDRRY